jgi:Ras-related protein Rab-1A
MLSGRVILVGPASVGKTALIERYTRNTFISDTRPTLGCDTRTKAVTVDSGEQVNLSLIDTAGQERYAEIAASFFRHADVCLLCFDLGNLASFDHVRWWKGKVEESNDSCLFVLVGTKQDLLKSVAGETDYARRYAASVGIPFFTTSSLVGGEQIDFLFYTVAEKIVRLRLQDKVKRQTPQIVLQPVESTRIPSLIPSNMRSCCQ